MARERLAVEPKPGHQIGAYRLLRLIGQGSTGRVFEVEHERIGRRAAMKTLAAEHATRSEAIKRLFAEAMAVNRINHPHIVEITDLVESGVHRIIENGSESMVNQRVNALVMELLEGQSLATAMATQGPLPAERFLPILAQVSEALAAAHTVGFAHRDLKPDNIFLIERDGHADFVKLLDFGLAKSTKVEPGKSNPSLRTLDGTFVGTPAYTSPEQASGKRIGTATDVYSVGVVLYELVTGRLPFEGRSVADFILQHLSALPPPLPKDVLSTPLGRTLDAVLHRCLGKNPDDRFTASQLAELLWALSKGRSVRFSISEDYRPPTPGPPARRRASVQIAWGLGIGLSAALIGAAVVGHVRRPVEPAEAPAVAAVPAGAESALDGAKPAAPALVTISIESEPPGAQARLAGSDTVLGVTPFVHQFPKEDRLVDIELRARGYDVGRLSVSTAVSSNASATLVKHPSAARSRAVARDSTIDPFQQ
ncbi:MAG TPA: serine/threonine-protein kinase [Polyangia bacterium]|nr:serine/threonine-protein kinase [Polyangia bacterium]